MNAQLKSVEPTIPRSHELSKRIETERQRLAELESCERDISTKRLRLLTAGNDADVDDCERNLDQNRGQQIRILDRVELLEAELKQVREEEERARLDDIAAAADRSRVEAEKLIRSDYLKAARALAGILAKLQASDTFIEQSNRELEKAGRAEVRSANMIRMRSRNSFEWIERKVVTAGDANHPQHADAHIVQGAGIGLGASFVWKSSTGQLIEPVEVEITHCDPVRGEYAEPLWKAITLPAIEPQGDPYIHANGHQLMDGKPAAPIWKADAQ